MPVDFAARGRSARERIIVPDVPLGIIVRRSHAARTRSRVGAFAVAGAIVAAVATAGTGAGARIASSVHLWLSGGEETLRVTSFSGTRSPMRAEFQEALAGATFPVVLPVGLPDGTRVNAIYASPLDHPSAFFVSYVNPRTGMKASFTLVDPSVVQMGRSLSAMASGPHAAVYDWRTGGEIVLVAKNQVTAPLVDGVKAAMATSSPAQSLAATVPMLSTIEVLGSGERVAIAEQHRAPSGPNVLIDAQQTRSVPALAKRGTPMRDSRRFRVLSFPYVNGVPDYSKARGLNAQTVAIPPSGVRAVAAVLRASGGASACNCEVLYGRPSAAAYRIVVIPESRSGDVRTYAVDAATFAVTPAG
jgi:hypothetical protein